MAKCAPLLVCTADDCKKSLKKHGVVLAAVARGGVEIERVGCQKLCHGPVFGTKVDGTWEWFGRVRSDAAVEALLALLEDGRMRKPLRKLRDTERSGKRRK